MKTPLSNNQSSLRIHMPAATALVRKLGDCLAEADPETCWSEVSVFLTDDAGILPVNREFFGKNRSTDVISFRYDPDPGEDGTSGELLVNAQCAANEGPTHDGVAAELALYMAHGFNHLAGADDNTPQKRAAMRRTETHRLSELQTEIKNLIIK